MNEVNYASMITAVAMQTHSEGNADASEESSNDKASGAILQLATPAGNTEKAVDAAFVEKYEPQVGGYYVEFESNDPMYWPAPLFGDGEPMTEEDEAAMMEELAEAEAAEEAKIQEVISSVRAERADEIEALRRQIDDLQQKQAEPSKTKGLDFGAALAFLRAGHKVARHDWNGKGMWLVLVPGRKGVEMYPGSAYMGAGIEVADINPHIDMKTVQGAMQPGWLASQSDMLADDWFVVF